MNETLSPVHPASHTSRRITVWLVAVLALSSGILNLYSVVRPISPARVAAIESFFPGGFVHLSRFVTLLAGVALIVVSANILKRKRRAFHTMLILLTVSAVFHVAKGLDYREAVISLASLLVLLPARPYFTVRSGRPGLKRTLVGVAFVVVVVATYGTLGFWFFDRREFGIEFNIVDSVRRTFEFLLFWAAPDIAARTRLAHWFIQSLYVLSITVIVYAMVELFRPALYRLRVVPRDRNAAASLLQRYGRCALDYFATWPDKSLFLTRAKDCFVAYRVNGNFAVALGDPIGPDDRVEAAIREFAAFCAESDWVPVFHQALPEFWPVYQSLGFRRLKLGDEAIVDLTAFSLEGRDQKDLRHSANKLERDGVRLQYFRPPVPDDVVAEARQVSNEWLQRGRRERRFTLGRFERGYVRSTTLLAAFDRDDRMLAFVNSIPSPRAGESTIDLMRQRAVAPNGIMDYLFVRLFLDERAKGFSRFNLGLAPMSGFEPDEVAGVEEKIIHYFFQRMNFLFNYHGLRQYKANFGTSWEPRYMIYQNPADLPRIALAIRRVTEIDDNEELDPDAFDLEHLPITEIQSTGRGSNALAVILSGDGGWNVTEKALGKRLAAAGVPVVGLNCLRYFCKRRTPDSSAHDLERVLDHYLQEWGKRDVVLIGYSRGACVLPFLANRMRADLRDRVREVVLLGPASRIDFKFHLADLITNVDWPASLPVLPEVEKLRGTPITCFCGRREKNCPCRDLPEGLATCVERPGGHLIWKDVEPILAVILNAVK